MVASRRRCAAAAAALLSLIAVAAALPVPVAQQKAEQHASFGVSEEFSAWCGAGDTIGLHLTALGAARAGATPVPAVSWAH